MDAERKRRIDEFVALVDEHITPRMGRLGYLRIHLGTEQKFELGYESESERARATIRPDDPLSADEVWLCYDPDTGELRFGLDIQPIVDVLPTFGSPAEPGPISDPGSPLTTRIRLLGEVVESYLKSHQDDH